MIGILLITHGSLGESLINCATHVLNKQPLELEALPVTGLDDPTTVVLLKARARVQALEAGSGVLILSDMYGGTPSNLASKLVIPGKIEAVAGVNLPMLIRVLTYRDRDLQTIVTKAISGGCDGVMRVPAFNLQTA